MSGTGPLLFLHTMCVGLGKEAMGVNGGGGSKRRPAGLYFMQVVGKYVYFYTYICIFLLSSIAT